MRNDALWTIGDTLIGERLKPDGRTRFHTFQDALDKVEEFATNLQSNVSITLEDDGMYQFFGNGTRIATWICGDEEHDLRIHGIFRKPKPKKGTSEKRKNGRLSFGRSNRNSHSGMVHMDVTPSPLSVGFLPIQDWIPTGFGFWRISCSLLGSPDPLTPQLPHFLTDFLDETHPRIDCPYSPFVPCTRKEVDG